MRFRSAVYPNSQGFPTILPQTELTTCCLDRCKQNATFRRNNFSSFALVRAHGGRESADDHPPSAIRRHHAPHTTIEHQARCGSNVSGHVSSMLKVSSSFIARWLRKVRATLTRGGPRGPSSKGWETRSTVPSKKLRGSNVPTSW